MFTGLVQTVGEVVSISRRDEYRVLEIGSVLPITEIQIGESISIDGACLTVISKSKQHFIAEASAETISRTVVGDYVHGTKVNLERALKVGDRLGGHFVSGHVDTLGHIDQVSRKGRSLVLTVAFDSGFDLLVIEKGSIAISGVSLTVNHCQPGKLSVNIIPLTIEQTNLGSLTSGQPVNLEFDLIGKYIRKSNAAGNKNGLTIDKLINSGW